MKFILYLIILVFSHSALSDAPPKSFDKGFTGIFLETDNTKKLASIAHNCKFDIGGAFCFSNTRNNQFVKFISYPGGIKYGFSYIQVIENPQSKYPLLPSKINHFESANGVTIGMSKLQVTSILGKPVSSMINSISYYLKNNAYLLNTYNMPIYSAEYRFENDRLIRFEFGFEYP